MRKGISRREFLRNSLIGGAAIGAGLSHYHLAYGQTTNIKFSTWHVPVGYEVKTVWGPMLEELRKRSTDRINYG